MAESYVRVFESQIEEVCKPLAVTGLNSAEVGSIADQIWFDERGPYRCHRHLGPTDHDLGRAGVGATQHREGVLRSAFSCAAARNSNSCVTHPRR